MSSLPVLAGMLESLRLLNSVDVDERADRALTLIRSLAEQLQARGYRLAGWTQPEEASALLTFRHPSVPADELARRLRAARVACGVVEDGLRISTHFYNTPADADALVAALPAV